MKLLLEKGANAKIRDTKGNTPLMAAASVGHVEACKVMLEAGQAIDLKNGIGQTALTIAVENDHPSVIAYLVEKEANKNITVKGNDLLMIAAANGAINSIKALIMFGFSPFTKNFRGQTALDVAKKAKQKKIVKLFERMQKDSSEKK